MENVQSTQNTCFPGPVTCSVQVPNTATSDVINGSWSAVSVTGSSASAQAYAEMSPQYRALIITIMDRWLFSGGHSLHFSRAAHFMFSCPHCDKQTTLPVKPPGS